MNEGIENPEAVGNPEETPVVQAAPGLVNALESSRCDDCGLVNWQHSDYCVASLRKWYDEEVRQPLARDLDETIKRAASKRRGLNG